MTGTEATTLGQMNPFRYRGYYYDNESGLYYLNSRYYDAETGRFVNADGQVSTGSDMSGMNLYAYCGNNPVNRVDSMGEAWWHWAIAATVVAVCAVAAGAFIGSATALGLVALTAASTSSSIKEFNNQGSWGTVATTIIGGFEGGYQGYAMSKVQTTKTNQPQQCSG